MFQEFVWQMNLYQFECFMVKIIIRVVMNEMEKYRYFFKSGMQVEILNFVKNINEIMK